MDDEEGALLVKEGVCLFTHFTHLHEFGGIVLMKQVCVKSRLCCFCAGEAGSSEAEGSHHWCG